MALVTWKIGAVFNSLSLSLSLSCRDSVTQDEEPASNSSPLHANFHYSILNLQLFALIVVLLILSYQVTYKKPVEHSV